MRQSCFALIVLVFSTMQFTSAKPILGKGVVLPDFSYAGYQFGEREWERPNNAKVFLVEDYGAVADDDIDDSAAFLACLRAAHAHEGAVIVKLSKGRYRISEILPISRSDFSLQGTGMGVDGTELYFARPLRMVNSGARFAEITEYLQSENKMQVEPENNVNLPFSPYSWTGGFIWIQRDGSRPFPYLDHFNKEKTESLPITRAERGALRLYMSAASERWMPGQRVRIQWRNRQGQGGKLIDEIYGTERQSLVSKVGSRLWEDPNRAVVTQITEIARVKGKQIWLRDPLLHPINADLPAQLSAWQGLSNVSLRDFAVRFPSGKSFGHHLEEGYNAVYLSDTMHAWIDSLRIIDADSAVLTYNSAASTISNVITEGQRKAHYSVHLGNVHGVLVRDLQVHNSVLHPLSFNTFCTRSVYLRAQVWQQGVIDQHAGVNQQNLVDQARLYMHARPNEQGQISYPLWDGSGAGYWQPGHGRYNTHWNIQVQVLSGADSDSEVLLTGLDEGPDARIVGVHGNRPFAIRYRPAPVVESLNRVPKIPSLYEWQRAQRLNKSL